MTEAPAPNSRWQVGDTFTIKTDHLKRPVDVSPGKHYTVTGLFGKTGVYYIDDVGDDRKIICTNIALVRPAYLGGDVNRPRAPHPSPGISVGVPAVSNGGSSSYYKIPEGSTDVIDLINHRDMNFNIGNIFKACYRNGLKAGNNPEYDVRKIKFFIDSEFKRLGLTDE